MRELELRVEVLWDETVCRLMYRGTNELVEDSGFENLWKFASKPREGRFHMLSEIVDNLRDLLPSAGYELVRGSYKGFGFIINDLIDVPIDELYDFFEKEGNR